MKLNTIGYGAWPTTTRVKGLTNALLSANVNFLIDIRHSPCSSNLQPTSNYGPRDWHLQLDGHGIDGHLAGAGIRYTWLVELGNPEKADPAMTILREQLKSRDKIWPVQRGLALLNELVRVESNRCCLLCVCRIRELPPKGRCRSILRAVFRRNACD